METRKVQRTGGTTLTVSLPKAWTRSAGLEAGSPVRLVPEGDGSLRVLPEARPRAASGRVRLGIAGDDPDRLARRLIAAYLAGHEVVELTAPRITLAQRAAIQSLTRKLIGPEIIEETLGCVVVQDLLDPAEFSIEKGVRRMLLIARAMHSDAITAVREGNGDLARDVEHRDDEVDRLAWLLTRQYNTLLRHPGAARDLTAVDALGLVLAARILERIADHAVRVARGALEVRTDRAPAAVLEELQEASVIALRVIDDAVGAVLEADPERAERAIRLAKRLEALRREVLGRILRLPAKEAVALAYVLESIERTGSYGTDISEVAINRAAVRTK